jgi:TonB family protein
VVEDNPDNWKQVSPSEGGFTVWMPGTPFLSKTQGQPASSDFPQYFYFLKTETGDYKVGYFELPDEISDPQQIKSIFDGMRNQMLAMNKSLKLLSERNLKIEENEGREWLIRDGDKILRKRYLIHGKRFYQMMLTVSRNVAFQTGKPSANPADRTNFYEATATKFFDSFKLIPGGTETPASNVESTDGARRIVIGGVLNGKAISKPAPNYPAAAKSAGVQGVVVVKIVIDEEGKVIKAEAVSGHPVLRDEAVKAALKARFTPTKLEGTPVKVTGSISYNFTLH